MGERTELHVHLYIQHGRKGRTKENIKNKEGIGTEGEKGETDNTSSLPVMEGAGIG